MTSFAPGTDPRYVEEVNNYFYGGGPKPDAKKWGLPGEFYPSGPDRMPKPNFPGGEGPIYGLPYFPPGEEPPEKPGKGWNDEWGMPPGWGGSGTPPRRGESNEEYERRMKDIEDKWNNRNRKPLPKNESPIGRLPGGPDRGWRGRPPGKGGGGFPGWPGPKPPGDEVDNTLREMYQKHLDRDVDEEGRKYWGDEIRSGRSTAEDVLANIRRSDEYAGVVENFLSDAYKSNLGRDADDEGFSYWADQLKSGKMDRDAVWSSIRDSDEGRKYQESRPPRDRPPIHGDPEGPRPPRDDWARPLPVPDNPDDWLVPFSDGQPHDAGPGTRREPRRSGIKDVFTAIGRDNQGRTEEQKDGIRKSAAMLGRTLASGIAARGL